MNYLSVCSGIEAATVAWHPLGWSPVAFAEIEPFPASVLAHHYPHVPNWGDMTKFQEWPDADVDALVGGTPCQSYSVAGLRAGLDDPRGDLMLTYAAIARRYRPRWVVWENVPGVLSSAGGRDFGSLLGLLSGRAIEVPSEGWQNSGIVPGIARGYGLAWRVLDAQYFGLAQRRKRVFVVGYLGDWRRAAAVLFERESLSGHPAPRRETGERVAGTLKGGSGERGYPDPSDGNGGGLVEIAGTVTAGAARRRGSGQDPQTLTLEYVPDIVPQAISAKWSKGAATIRAMLAGTHRYAVPQDLTRIMCEAARHIEQLTVAPPVVEAQEPRVEIASWLKRTAAPPQGWEDHVAEKLGGVEAPELRTESLLNTHGSGCTWSCDDEETGESWDTTCGQKFTFIEGGPKENGMTFCCYCGGKLMESPLPALPQGKEE